MNEIMKSIYARKSVRAYEDRPISADIRQALLEAALQAPTAGNMTLYTILDITDPELKQRLSVTCDNQPFNLWGAFAPFFTGYSFLNLHLCN